jgi:hypothetical protein
MVNFGAHLSNHAVNRWARQYVKYTELKEKIQKASLKLSGDSASAVGRSISPQAEATVLRSESSIHHSVSTLFAPLIREDAREVSSDLVAALTEGALGWYDHR